MYKRVLLKLSGEQLAGKYEFGIDPAIAKYFANEIKSLSDTNTQIVLVVGGGNMVRGAEVAEHGIKRVTGDQMGMLSGLINAMGLTDIFEAQNVPTRCLSNIFAQQIAESYSFRLAEKHLERKRVVIIAGGLGRPYFTHDTAAINLALELGCDLVLKATKVDGVYDKDPLKNEDAVKIQNLSFQNAVENPSIKVMDKAALGLAMEQKMPIIIFDAMTSGNLKLAISGKSIGTRLA